MSAERTGDDPAPADAAAQAAAGAAADPAAECLRLAAALAEAQAERERAQAQLGRFVEDLLLVNRQRKAALQEAQKSARSQSRFLGQVSDELRAPLTTIVGFAELLARDPDAADRADSADRIRRAALRLNTTVDRLIDATRHGEPSRERAPAADLAACLTAVVEADRRGRAVGRRSIDLRLPSHPVMLACDAARLQQALALLLDEAAGAGAVALHLQAAQGGGTASLTLTADATGTVGGIGQVLVEALFEAVGAEVAPPASSGAQRRWVITFSDQKK